MDICMKTYMCLCYIMNYSLNIYWSPKCVQQADILCCIGNSFERVMQKGAFAIELLFLVCFKNCVVCVLFLCRGFVNLFMVHILLTYYVIIISFISEHSWKLAFFGGL